MGRQERSGEKMVFFTCGSCGDNIKKPKVEKHLQQCRTNELTCIDCNQLFDRKSFTVHKSCITENERYGGKDYVEKGAKGEVKQKNWMSSIQQAMESAVLSKGAQDTGYYCTNVKLCCFVLRNPEFPI